MSVQTAVSPRLTQKVVQFPLVRIIIGIVMVMVPVAAGQLLIMSLSIPRPWFGLAVMLFTVPMSYGAYYAFVHYVERRAMTEFALPGAARETVLGALTGALMFSALIGIFALVGACSVQGVNGWGLLLSPLLASISSGVFEEILFRGVLFRVIERSLGSWLALLISSAIFGALHLINPHATLVGAVAVMLEAGIALGAAYMLTRRLWLAIGIHFAWNFFESGVFGLVVSGNDTVQGFLRSSLTGPDWLTGGSFGPEASLVAIVVCLVVGVYFIWRAAKRGNILKPYWQRPAGE